MLDPRAAEYCFDKADLVKHFMEHGRLQGLVDVETILGRGLTDTEAKLYNMAFFQGANRASKFQQLTKEIACRTINSIAKP